MRKPYHTVRLPASESNEESTTLEDRGPLEGDDAGVDNDHMSNEILEPGRPASTYEDFKLNLVDYEEPSNSLSNDLSEPLRPRPRRPQPGPALTPWQPRLEQSPGEEQGLKPGPALTPWRQGLGRDGSGTSEESSG